MRHTGLALLPIALLAAPLAAQNFEGTIALKLPGASVSAMTWNIKGPMSLASFASSTQSKTEIKYVLDHTAQTNTILMPFAVPPQMGTDVKGMRMTNDLRSAPSVATEGGGPEIALRPLGTSQTIAGVKCDDYELSDSLHTRACLSGALGSFVYPNAVALTPGGAGMVTAGATPLMISLPDGRQATVVSGGSMSGGNGASGGTAFVMSARMSTSSDSGATGQIVTSNSSTGERRVMTMGPDGNIVSNEVQATGGERALRAGPPAWAKAIHGAGFPLKVWVPGGKVLLETSGITRMPVADELFLIPDGYIDPSEFGTMLRNSLKVVGGGH